MVGGYPVIGRAHDHTVYTGEHGGGAAGGGGGVFCSREEESVIFTAQQIHYIRINGHYTM